MDKNKSAHKLRGFGPIYYTNLDGQPDRKQWMESQFDYWEIEDYTRISGHDGREDDLSDIISGRYPENMSSGEIGCVTSHLKAIKHWYEISDSPYAVIMEDDCDLSIVKNWNFTWQDSLLEFHIAGMLFNLQSFVLEISLYLFIQDSSMTLVQHVM